MSPRSGVWTLFESDIIAHFIDLWRGGRRGKDVLPGRIEGSRRESVRHGPPGPNRIDAAWFGLGLIEQSLPNDEVCDEGPQMNGHRCCRPRALTRREDRHRCRCRVGRPGLQMNGHRCCRPRALTRREDRHRCRCRVGRPGLQMNGHRCCRPRALTRREDRHRCSRPRPATADCSL